MLSSLKFDQNFVLLFITWRTTKYVIFGMFTYVHKLPRLILIFFTTPLTSKSKSKSDSSQNLTVGFGI